MKLPVKLAVSAALTLASAGAFAVTLPSTGDGSLTLTLFSTNDGTPFSYAFDTGLTFSQATPALLNTPGTTLTFNLTGLSADLASTAGQAALTNGLVFDVTAASATGGITTVGALKLETTFDPSVSLATISAIQSGAISAAEGANNKWLTNFGATNPSFTTNTADANYANANYNASLETFAVNAAASTSSALPFYELTNNRGTTSVGNTTTYAGTWSIDLTADTLTYTVAGAAVPLPPSVWLMISGLAGLAVLGRRRKGDFGALPA